MTTRVSIVCGVLTIAAVLAGCATPGLEKQVSELRVQVGQIAAQRDRLDGALRALAGDRGGVAPGGGAPGDLGVPVVSRSDPSGGGVPADSIATEAVAPEPAGAPTAIDHYRRGYVLFHQGEFDRAEEEMGRFLVAAPTHPAAADARYWIGECFFGRGKYREAIGAWRPVAESDNPADRPDRALMRLGAAFALLGDLEMARTAFQKVLETWPDGDAAPSAREAIVRLAAPGDRISIP
jgi:TolA-binding protein